ncbi:class I SAM-dependent methyltransferase [Aphanothece sacrum]|uniref:Methyltransferase n=1 Tax=Aphanothece sacrum FPU1 TaxID=1920663 RepID=A0A401IKV2_APHSA|nr:methyltransferase domain-containing protein [Aphanothece sacrum]GBF81884.1 methyltransferase [Aphanothece sacrum FPU1]GBF83513.1 methyltransferase [Aphanothece sacrum FPU3]
MATILRTWSYQYPWLYNTVSRLAAIAVGGETRFHQLPLQDISIDTNTKILDLCCGGGQATRFLVERSSEVTGLDASPNALKRAKQAVPRGSYVEGLAEQMPFADEQFDVVHTSVALHEMEPEQLQKILKEVYRVLKPGGIFTLIDLHQPTNPLFWPSLAIFIWLFETETAWSLLKTDLVADLKTLGWRECHQRLYAGGSLQVVQGTK